MLFRSSQSTTTPNQNRTVTLKPGPARTEYTSARRNLKLIMEDVNEDEPSEVAYVYSGYAPLSVRLVQCILQRGYISSISRGLFASALARSGGGGSSTSHQAESKSLQTQTQTRQSSGQQGHSSQTQPQSSNQSQSYTSTKEQEQDPWSSLDNILSSISGPTFSYTQLNTSKASKARDILSGNGRVSNVSNLTSSSARTTVGGGSGTTTTTSVTSGPAVRQTNPSTSSLTTTTTTTSSPSSPSPHAQKTTLLFYLGGITQSEIASLRLISKQMVEQEGQEGSQKNGGRKLVIATTGIINFRSVVTCAMERVEE